MNYRLIGLACTVLLLIGCASRSPHQNEQKHVDTLECFNRAMFNFNYNIVDPYLIRPVAVVWRDGMPQPARNGLSNFFSNLEEPASMINGFLIGDPYKAMKHFNRFFLNTLLGMGGFIDVASMANPKLVKEVPYRFGSTLGRYDVGYGPYAVLPVYGSATLRQDGGKWVDTLYPMLSYLTFWMSAGKWVIEGVETRAQLLDSDGLLRNSSDPYQIVRDAYFQRYDFLANGGVLSPEANPNALAIQDDLQSIDASH
ncbi:phospholipid-binding lipoprotein MlaA [Candidatus Fukatsuia symbiotica]|uniref:phospholipid-binding lipoprotein MlaA n=1 Tax=Candidatus Fukatsuia TaxID=1927833 RepID=UPI000932618D|nr:phospholipid-binding lipoprotein MlaA [Candidatus Fukatsuia symbiotica]MEA9445992.1 phospholipid-binding lipoprotein MlaA [Candidatus Fukatsuia symbiotica]